MITDKQLDYILYLLGKDTYYGRLKNEQYLRKMTCKEASEYIQALLDDKKKSEEYKEVKKLSTKNVNKSNKRNSKITKLERNRTSIFTDDLEHCIICGNKKDNLHEILYGRNRLNSMKYGFVIPLCFDHHVGNRGIHYNRKLDLFYKKKCQECFENNIGDRLEFIRIFGKSYL